MKFIIDTLIFTLVYYLVDWVWNLFDPLPESGIFKLLNLENLQDPDALLNNPQAITALQNAMSDTSGFDRMIHVSLATSLIMVAIALGRKMQLRTGAKGAIRWDSNANFLSIQTDTSPNQVGMGGKASCRIAYFVFKGANTSRQPLLDVDGYIQSAKTRVRIPLALDGVVQSGSYSVPPKSDILITARFHSPSGHAEGYGIDEFWREFGPFRFVLNYNDKQYYKMFDQKMLETLINRRVRELRRL